MSDAMLIADPLWVCGAVGGQDDDGRQVVLHSRAAWGKAGSVEQGNPLLPHHGSQRVVPSVRQAACRAHGAHRLGLQIPHHSQGACCATADVLWATASDAHHAHGPATCPPNQTVVNALKGLSRLACLLPKSKLQWKSVSKVCITL